MNLFDSMTCKQVRAALSRSCGWFVVAAFVGLMSSCAPKRAFSEDQVLAKPEPGLIEPA